METLRKAVFAARQAKAENLASEKAQHQALHKKLVADLKEKKASRQQLMSFAETMNVNLTSKERDLITDLVTALYPEFLYDYLQIGVKVSVSCIGRISFSYVKKNVDENVILHFDAYNEACSYYLFVGLINNHACDDFIIKCAKKANVISQKTLKFIANKFSYKILCLVVRSSTFVNLKAAFEFVVENYKLNKEAEVVKEFLKKYDEPSLRKQMARTISRKYCAGKTFEKPVCLAIKFCTHEVDGKIKSMVNIRDVVEKSLEYHNYSIIDEIVKRKIVIGETVIKLLIDRSVATQEFKLAFPERHAEYFAIHKELLMKLMNAGLLETQKPVVSAVVRKDLPIFFLNLVDNLFENIPVGEFDNFIRVVKSKRNPDGHIDGEFFANALVAAKSVDAFWEELMLEHFVAEDEMLIEEYFYNKYLR